MQNDDDADVTRSIVREAYRRRGGRPADFDEVDKMAPRQQQQRKGEDEDAVWAEEEEEEGSFRELMKGGEPLAGAATGMQEGGRQGLQAKKDWEELRAEYAQGGYEADAEDKADEARTRAPS